MPVFLFLFLATAVMAAGVIDSTRRGLILTGSGLLLLLTGYRLMDFSEGLDTHPGWWALGLILGLVGSFLVPWGLSRAIKWKAPTTGSTLRDPSALHEWQDLPGWMADVLTGLRKGLEEDAQTGKADALANILGLIHLNGYSHKIGSYYAPGHGAEEVEEIARALHHIRTDHPNPLLRMMADRIWLNTQPPRF